MIACYKTTDKALLGLESKCKIALDWTFPGHLSFKIGESRKKWDAYGIGCQFVNGAYIACLALILLGTVWLTTFSEFVNL